MEMNDSHALFDEVIGVSTRSHVLKKSKIIKSKILPRITLTGYEEVAMNNIPADTDDDIP